MKKIYKHITVLFVVAITLTGCNSDKSSLQELKIDATNTHIRDLTKDFWVSLDRWQDVYNKRLKITNAWVNSMHKKYTAGNKCDEACGRQLNFYNKYLEIQRESGKTIYLNLLLEGYIDANGDIDKFEYAPGHKQELLTVIAGFQENIDKVSSGLHRGVYTHWDTGIDPIWAPSIKQLRSLMWQEEKDLDHAGRVIAKIKELVQRCQE